MSNETAKSNRLRGPEFFEIYLSSSVIDIGCGTDVVVPHARPFDIGDGDANRITAFVSETFDCVYSSHCLEHMYDPVAALREWWSLVAPSGYLVVVVPDEALYEQGYWPSLFNPDHKASFTLDQERQVNGRTVHNLPRLVAELPGATLLGTELQDVGYDHRLTKHGEAKGLALHRFYRWRETWIAKIRLRLLRGACYRAHLFISALEALLGRPVDQTLGEALAQIQIVARKVPASPE